MSNAKPAIFLDRDGVINKDNGYVSQIDDFELCNMDVGDDLSWYSTPSRLNITAKEMSALINAVPAMLKIIFAQIEGSDGYLFKGGGADKCYKLMLNVMCGGFAPPCRYENGRCTEEGKHCPDLCDDFTTCLKKEFSELHASNSVYNNDQATAMINSLKMKVGHVYDLWFALFQQISSRAKATNNGMPLLTEQSEKLSRSFIIMVSEVVAAMGGSSDLDIDFNIEESVEKAGTVCETFIFQHRDYRPSAPDRLACRNKKENSTERSRRTRKESYAHGRVNSNGHPLPLTKEEELLYPYSCIPRITDNKNNSYSNKKIVCPHVCKDGDQWILRIRSVTITMTWLVWIGYTFLALCVFQIKRKKTVNDKKYLQDRQERKTKQELFDESIQSIPKGLWVRLLFPFILNLAILIPLLNKMSILYGTDARIWTENNVDIHLVIFFIILAISISTHQLYSVTSTVFYGGISNVRFFLRIDTRSSVSNVTRKRSKLKSMTISRSRRPKCSCKHGPMTWYSLWCGLRRGHLFFWKMFASELCEWLVQYSSFSSLVYREHIYYLYATLMILLLNVLISPWAFLCRTRSPFVREFVYVVDIVLDLCYALVASSFLDQESDFRVEVTVLGFIKLPAIYTCMLWPTFTLIFRTRSLVLTFLRNFADPKLGPSSKRFSIISGGRTGRDDSRNDTGNSRKKFSIIGLLAVDDDAVNKELRSERLHSMIDEDEDFAHIFEKRKSRSMVEQKNEKMTTYSKMLTSSQHESFYRLIKLKNQTESE